MGKIHYYAYTIIFQSHSSSFDMIRLGYTLRYCRCFYARYQTRRYRRHDIINIVSSLQFALYMYFFPAKFYIHSDALFVLRQTHCPYVCTFIKSV